MVRFVSLPIGATGLLLALSTAVAAQSYPTKPVRLVVPFPAGGSNDIVGRLIGTPLSSRLGKQVNLDNRGGAGSVIGTEIVANAPKDGYTLLMVSLQLGVTPWVYKLSYDPIKSFAPVAMLATGANMLVVHPDLPVKSVQELIALAKEKPGQLQYASAGTASGPHLAGELFKMAAGVDLLHVPFKGGGPALIDVLGGHTKVMFPNLVAALGHVRSGKLRVLGVGSLKRNAMLADVPTIAESGVSGYEAVNWWGIVAPAGTPANIIERLHKEISEVQALPAVQQQFATEGVDVVQMSSAEFGAFMVKEIDKWGRVVKQSGIKAE